MTKTILNVLLLITINVYGQNNDKPELRGNWIKYNIEMKDGSQLIDRFLTDSSYLNFSFKENKMCINGNPTHHVNMTCLPYTIQEDYIKTSSTSGYQIEGIANDTLILSERMEGFENDKLKRFYFVRAQKLFNDIKKKKGDLKNQIANQFYTPVLTSSLMLQLNKGFKKKHSNFKVKGTITIDLKNEKINTLIHDATTADSSNLQRIKTIINNSYSLWNLDKFKHIETLQMPFVLKDEKTKTYRGITVKFFTDSFYQLDNFYGGDIRVIQKARTHFNKGLKAYQKKKYEDAITFFSKSYRLDSKNIDALYNRAAIHYETGKLVLACKDWEELSQLGQIKGTTLFTNHCRKPTTNKIKYE
ncbi:MAG: tetratricopeptide repeat protein [Winogradskyella arenosi]